MRKQFKDCKLVYCPNDDKYYTPVPKTFGGITRFESTIIVFRNEYEDVCREYFKDHVGFELIAKVWHPRNIHKFADWGVSVEDPIWDVNTDVEEEKQPQKAGLVHYSRNGVKKSIQANCVIQSKGWVGKNDT